MYNLLNPYNLTAKVFIKNTTYLIEKTPSISKESDGVFFALLNNNFYSFDNDYDLIWYVKYNNVSPLKKLITSFRIKPINISSNINVSLNKNKLNYKLENQNNALKYNLNNQEFQITILNKDYEHTNFQNKTV